MARRELDVGIVGYIPGSHATQRHHYGPRAREFRAVWYLKNLHAGAATRGLYPHVVSIAPHHDVSANLYGYSVVPLQVNLEVQGRVVEDDFVTNLQANLIGTRTHEGRVVEASVRERLSAGGALEVYLFCTTPNVYTKEASALGPKALIDHVYANAVWVVHDEQIITGCAPGVGNDDTPGTSARIARYLEAPEGTLAHSF